MSHWAWLLLCKTLVCFEAFAILDPKVALFSCQRVDNICLKIGNNEILYLDISGESSPGQYQVRD